MPIDRRGPIDLRIFEQIFYGKHFAVGLRAAGNHPGQKLVRFALLYKDQDDCGWFLAGNHLVVSDRGAPSFALADLAAVSAEAHGWCVANCDPHVVPLLSGEVITVGWEFRDERKETADA